MQDTILILDFGSQYTQLIARRIRELNVYCEIHPFHNVPDNIQGEVKGVIFSGSPSSVHDAEAPVPDYKKWLGKVPLLGVCYGAQFLAQELGGKVARSEIREYGRANLTTIRASVLMDNVPVGSQVWMSHGDTITKLPETHFEIIASTADVQVAGYHSLNYPLFGLQFHPEVYHSTDGQHILKKFCGEHLQLPPGFYPGPLCGCHSAKSERTVG